MPEVGIYISKVFQELLEDEKPDGMTEAEFEAWLLAQGLDVLKQESDRRHEPDKTAKPPQ